MHRRSGIAAAVLCSILLLPNSACTTAHDRNTVLPESVATLFPGHVLMDVAEFDPLLQQVLASNDPYPAGQSPTWLQADFDGNGVADHALLLRTPPGVEPQGEIMAVVLGLDGGRYEIAHSESHDYVLDYAYFYVVNAETLVRPTQAYDSGKEDTRISNPGIGLAYFEKSSVVYFWDGTLGRIDEIWTSD